MRFDNSYADKAIKIAAGAAIILSTSAAGVYAHRNGYFEAADGFFEESCRPVLVKAGIFENYPRYILIGLDITAGREHELARDRAAISKLINETRLGDVVEVYLIHSKSESDQETVFEAAMPEDSGPMGGDFTRAKQKAIKDWEACWKETVIPAMTSGRKQQTDLFGFMRYVSGQKPEFMEHKHANLVLFTDGQHVGGGNGYNMEKRAPEVTELQKLKEQGLLPELSGVNVNFVGVTATHKVTNAHWRQLQTFWLEYVKEAGASKAIVTSDRKVRLL